MVLSASTKTKSMAKMPVSAMPLPKMMSGFVAERSTSTTSTSESVQSLSCTSDLPEDIGQVQSQLLRLRIGEPLYWMQILARRSPPPGDRVDLVIQFPSRREYKRSKRSQMYQKQFTSVGLKWRRHSEKLQILVTIPDELMFFLASKLELRMKLIVNDDTRWRKYLANHSLQGAMPARFWTKFNVDNMHQYEPVDKDGNVFTTAQRALVIHFILVNINFRVGYDFSQHGLNVKTGFKKTRVSHTFEMFVPRDMNAQVKLAKQWASITHICSHQQPLDDIKEYYGASVSVYFAWLGFLSKWCLYAMLIFIPVILYDIVSTLTPLGGRISGDVCSDLFKDQYRCPICLFPTCNFTSIAGECFPRMWMDFHVNGVNTAYCLVISVWSVCLLHSWRVYIDRQTHHWEKPIEMAPTLSRQPSRHSQRHYWRQINAYIRKWRKYLTNFSLSTFAIYGLPIAFGLIIFFVIAAVIDMYTRHLQMNPKMSSVQMFLAKRVAAVVIFISIRLFNPVARIISLQLAIMEGDFSNSSSKGHQYFHSCVVKIISIITFFTSLSYWIFIIIGKGYLKRSILKDDVDRPLWKPVDILGTRCYEDNCLYELSVGIASLLTVECVASLFSHGVVPWLSFCFNHQWKQLKGSQEVDEENMFECFGFNEYYLQSFLLLTYTTFFISALPYAPVIFIFYNFIRLRIDAVVLVRLKRRLPPTMSVNLGPWEQVFTVVSYGMVIWNGLVVSFASEFVPRLEHIYDHGSLAGYVNKSFAYQHATDFRRTWYPPGNYCRYRGFYKPAWIEPNCYTPSEHYYYLLKIRFLVFFVYVAAVFTIAYLLLKVLNFYQRHRYDPALRLYDILCAGYVQIKTNSASE